MLNVEHLARVEVSEQFPGLRQVVTMIGEQLYKLFLFRNVLLALLNVPLGLLQMLKLHFAMC
ncbi:hypothetical protein [Bradyrhizobium sp. USDA 4452]